MARSKGKDKALKFDQAIEQVEAIIEKIDAGDVDLEQCVSDYEAGVKLLKHCDAILNKAEKKIAELSAKGGG